MKALPAIFLFLTFSTATVSWALPATECAAQADAPDSVRVTVGERHIEVIGWMHLNQSDINTLRDGFNEAMVQADKNECFMAKNALASALTKQTADLKAAQTIYRQLEALHVQKPISYIGVESTPSELAENLAAQRSINTGLQSLQVRCGSMIAPETSSFSLVLPGPEYIFNTSYQGTVSLKALEEDAVKEANRRQVASHSVNTMSGVQARNKVMAKRALSGDGNGAIVVGKLHVPGLVSELIRQCKAM